MAPATQVPLRFPRNVIIIQRFSMFDLFLPAFKNPLIKREGSVSQTEREKTSLGEVIARYSYPEENLRHEIATGS